jgi:hypothetical protein
MTTKRFITLLAFVGLVLLLLAFVPQGITSRASASAASAVPATAAPPGLCTPVGGVLMTNIGVIDGKTNLGPVFGDLAGSVAAEPLTNEVGYHHNWVTTSGDTIYFKDALLHADAEDLLDGGSVVAVRWGHYRSDIIGGTGKFQNATGHLDYFGLADFNTVDPVTNQPGMTLVLRYRGQVCYAR